MGRINIRDALARISPSDRQALQLAFNEQFSHCVAVDNEYVVGVHCNTDTFEIVEKTEHGWFLGRIV